MPPFIKWENFHTHDPVGIGSESPAIRSYSLEQAPEIDPNLWHSVGLHPWESDKPDAFRKVDKLLPAMLETAGCVAVGECGLDRLRGASLPIQTELLLLQMQIAEERKLPVIIHCVRAWSELKTLFRESPFHGKKAIHGFNSNQMVLESYLADDWYISVCPNKRGELPDIIRHIPSNRLLLENDDTRIPIEQIIKSAASKLNRYPDAVRKVVGQNIRRFLSFGH